MSEQGQTYVIYYGWLTQDERGEPNADAQRIAAARAPLLIAHHWTAAPERHLNLSEAVLELMRGSGTEVYAYVATDCGKSDLKKVLKEVGEYLATDIDGIFFDEADPLSDDAKIPFYDRLGDAVRDKGKGVILNTGVAQCDERIMNVADRIMVEHQWRNLRTGSLWSHRYPPERFMGVSSNEGGAMGYAVDEQRALGDTREAWASRIGWHTSTDRYTGLPEWFERYVGAVKQT